MTDSIECALSHIQHLKDKRVKTSLGDLARSHIPEDALPLKKRNLRSRSAPYLIPYAKVHSVNEKTNRWFMKNALREVFQKRTKNSKAVREMKLKYYNTSTKTFMCPRCSSACTYLTAAHVGDSASSIIDRVLDAAPDTDNYMSLYSAVWILHQSLNVAVCCKDCNNDLEEGFTHKK